MGIRLVAHALEEVDIARYQLAHELVHCLAPTGESSALVVEEGAATRYQQGYSKKHLGGRVWLNSEKYKKALYLYNELTKQQSGAVKRLRRIEPCFFNWTHETFELAGMSFNDEIERQLLTRFDEF